MVALTDLTGAGEKWKHTANAGTVGWANGPTPPLPGASPASPQVGMKTRRFLAEFTVTVERANAQRLRDGDSLGGST